MSLRSYIKKWFNGFICLFFSGYSHVFGSSHCRPTFEAAGGETLQPKLTQIDEMRGFSHQQRHDSGYPRKIWHHFAPALRSDGGNSQHSRQYVYSKPRWKHWCRHALL